MPKPLMCPPELLTKDLAGRRYVVTGANGGIGLVAAKQLAKQGAEVILACRRTDAGEAAAAGIQAELGDRAKLAVEALDLGDLDSVRAFAARLSAKHETLHGLLNNAGVMNTPAGTTQQGFETQFGVNHLGHFLLTELLTPMLIAGAPARVVNVSSCFHDQAMGREGTIDLGDLNWQRRDYDGWAAYAQSKLANLLHAKALAKRLADTGVTAVSVHPGWVRTDLMRHSMPSLVEKLARPFMRLAGMIEPWEGAQTSLYALLADEVPEQPGAFYSQTGVYRDRSLNKGGWPLRSPNPQAHDDELADRLWVRSEELVGLAQAS
jgi:NAD(P)-dependent dehydrogenase (short-subunit alcohol dehydrogenase family)